QTFARLTRGGAADSSILRGVGMSTWRKVRRAERVQLELVSLDADPARDGVAYTVRVRNCGSAQAAGVVVHLVTAGELVARAEAATIAPGAEITASLVARAATTLGVDVGEVALIRRRLPSTIERAPDPRGQVPAKEGLAGPAACGEAE